MSGVKSERGGSDGLHGAGCWPQRQEAAFRLSRAQLGSTSPRPRLRGVGPPTSLVPCDLFYAHTHRFIYTAPTYVCREIGAIC